MARAVIALSPAQQRRAICVGRASALGLAMVADVVYADVWDHGHPGLTMPTGTLVVRVWGGDPHTIARTVDHHRPGGTLVVPIVYPATRRARLRALLRRVAWWVRTRPARRALPPGAA